MLGNNGGWNLWNTQNLLMTCCVGVNIAHGWKYVLLCCGYMLLVVVEGLLAVMVLQHKGDSIFFLFQFLHFPLEIFISGFPFRNLKQIFIIIKYLINKKSTGCYNYDKKNYNNFSFINLNAN